MSYYITAHAAIRYYMLATQSGDREVGGRAKFHTDEHGNMIYTETRVIKQESSACYFEIGEKENALHLEELVGDDENPADWGTLFHTHPSGMGASMSGVDVKQLTEMAKDLPGTVVRSMILSQGKIIPVMHEAACIDGRVFFNDDIEMTLLDTTGALDDLKKIGFFDKPKVAKKVTTGYTTGYGKSLTPARAFDSNDGWYDEAPQSSEVVDVGQSSAWGFDTATDAAYSAWLDEKRSDEKYDAAASYIDEVIVHKGVQVSVIDAYDWDGDIVLVLPDNTEVLLDDVTFPQQQAQ